MDGSGMTCRESTENLVAGIRGELTPGESSALRSHVEGCTPCRGEETAARSLADLLQQVPDIQPSQGGWDDLKSRIDEETTAAATGRGRRLYLLAGALAAACLLLLALLPAEHSRLTPGLGTLTLNGSPVSGRDSIEIGAGASIEALSLARLELESRRRLDLVLAPGTKLVHESPGTMRLEEGRMLAEVLPGGETIRFRTPAGDAEIAGTTFQLEVAGGDTTLTVIRGEVILRTGEKPVRVSFGNTVFVPRGGAPEAPVRVDPWRVRDWCSAPTPLLTLAADRLVLTLKNDTVSPLVLRPYHPDSADYHLMVEGPGAPPAPVKVQAVMVAEGMHKPGRPDFLTLQPGEAYRVAFYPAKLGLSTGSWDVRAVYRPYKDLPDGAWRGTLETDPRKLTIE